MRLAGQVTTDTADSILHWHAVMNKMWLMCSVMAAWMTHCAFLRMHFADLYCPVIP